MTTVYVDPIGIAVSEGRGVGGSKDHGTLLPGAFEALERLCDARYDVVLLTDKPVPELAALNDRVRYERLPSEGSGGARRPGRSNGDRPWLIASDTGWSERERPPGMRTIRVGPKLPIGRRQGLRFDFEARDFPAAVMEVLVRDTMPQ